MTDKETMAIIKQMVADGQISQEVAEKYFPELAESDDEKVRKAIINVFASHKDYEIFFGASVKDILAWLEKQGEKPQGKSALEAINEEKVDNANKVEPKDYSSIDPYFFKPVDKIEQKPVWGEEDEKKLKWLCRIVHSQRVNNVITLKEESELGQWMDKWLNHNPQSHWKPSEEQLKALEGCVDYLNESDNEDLLVMESLLEQLKAL